MFSNKYLTFSLSENICIVILYNIYNRVAIITNKKKKGQNKTRQNKTPTGNEKK